MGCGSGCGCGGNESSGVSRREVLGAMAAAAVSLSVLAPGARADDAAPAAAEWLKTVKATDLADKSAQNITGHPVVLTRDGTTVHALSSKCTHKGGTVKESTSKATLTCPLHGAVFDYTGKNLSGPRNSPATLAPLFCYPVRLNADGVIEVDTSRHLTKDDKDATLTLTA